MQGNDIISCRSSRVNAIFWTIFFCLFAALTVKMPQYVRDLGGVSSFSSSTSDIWNSKLEESTRLMCSAGLLMHDLIIDFYK